MKLFSALQKICQSVKSRLAGQKVQGDEEVELLFYSAFLKMKVDESGKKCDVSSSLYFAFK